METSENDPELSDLPEVSAELPVICQPGVDKVEVIHNMGDAKENSEEKTETTSPVKDSEEKTETTSPVKDSEEKIETTSSVKDSEEKTETTSPVKDSEEKTETTSSVKDSEEKTETTSPVKDSEEKTEATSSVKDSEEKTEATSSVKDSEGKTETTSPVKDFEEKTETTSSVKDSEEKTEATSSVKDSEEKTEATSSVQDSETSKSSTSIKVMKKKKASGFQAPTKAPSMSNGDTVGKVKPQKTKETEPKKSIDPVEQESVGSKEVKPKETKKSIKKQSNDVDKEKDSVKPKNTKKSSMTGGAEVLPADDSVQTPISSECNKEENTTKSKKAKLKETEKKEKASEPVKTLSAEEWEQVFQSAIDRVMNTPLDQLLSTDEELVQNTTTQNEDEDENKDVILEDSSQNASGLTVDIPNDKLEIEVPEQIQENSRNHDFPLENEHIQMVECAQVQELNENTPEGSELEFNGEEDKKQQHTPVVLVKKAMKKADRNSAAKVLAPRQLHFPKPIEIKKGKKKMMDVVKKKKGKRTEFAENVNDIVKDQPGISKKQLMMEREIQETGTWVQCSNTACQKWRFLQDINDPTEIDDKWICEMNKDTSYDSCEKREQDYDESDHIFTRYSEGSIVWARMVGYPWWPAMVEIDPDTETFFELVSENSMFPSHYHVVYLDNKVSRAWVKASAMLPFHHGGEDLNKGLYLTKKSKGPNFKKEVEAATQNALAALELPTKERLKQFSFSAQFKGKWAEDETKSRKIKKHCRVKLTPKKSKKKVKKPKDHTSENNAEHQDLTMYMLDSATVDEMLSDQPDSILKGIEDVLDSLGSQILSDDNDEDYLPTNTECEMFTGPTESRKDVSPIKKPKGILHDIM
ncbi:Zinc finger CW-type PWWP domain protein 1 [Mizuhopecten yessoensis]|uniref:Zinc finger CW-type PWWP domain protein 1 n=1 Tax=Mizuhopecten yessoensis TaxID=6573 RepID=A0A210PX56_MIZYE|nr:Zinc finger CW-type PWWP domain protein 1 [Mizuhopecten yessoensis]